MAPVECLETTATRSDSVWSHHYDGNLAPPSLHPIVGSPRQPGQARFIARVMLVTVGPAFAVSLATCLASFCPNHAGYEVQAANRFAVLTHWEAACKYKV